MASVTESQTKDSNVRIEPPATFPLKLCFLPCLSSRAAQSNILSPYTPAPTLDYPSSPPSPPPAPLPPSRPIAFARDRRIVSLESGRLLSLTQQDLDAISSLWEKTPDKHLWCQRLFLKIFSLKPSMTKIMQYHGLQVKEVMESPRFHQHCSNFVQFWDQIITMLSRHHSDQRTEPKHLESIGDPSSIPLTLDAAVISRIRAVGASHSAMPGVTFDAESWMLFKNVLLESVCGQRRASLRCEDQDKNWVSWCKLVTFVVSEMKDAFNESVRMGSNTL